MKDATPKAANRVKYPQPRFRCLSVRRGSPVIAFLLFPSDFCFPSGCLDSIPFAVGRIVPGLFDTRVQNLHIL
jgi:hypothetical protein